MTTRRARRTKRRSLLLRRSRNRLVGLAPRRRGSALGTHQEATEPWPRRVDASDCLRDARARHQPKPVLRNRALHRHSRGAGARVSRSLRILVWESGGGDVSPSQCGIVAAGPVIDYAAAKRDFPYGRTPLAAPLVPAPPRGAVPFLRPCASPPGRLSRIGLSRPRTDRRLVQRSHTFRPACSLNRPRRSVPSETSTDSLPPPPLRLLPAGATHRRVGVAPTECAAHSILNIRASLEVPKSSVCQRVRKRWRGGRLFLVLVVGQSLAGLRDKGSAQAAG